jgi:hypothetical protein
MNKNTKFSFLFSCFLAMPAHAVDGIALTAGAGEDANMAALSLQWDWEKRWFTEGDWSLGGYWEFDASYWKGDGPSPNKDVFGIGFTPVFRLERTPINQMAPYAEFGIGIHQFSTTKINDDESMGTTFQFGDHIGLGLRFGEDLKYDFGYRYQHYSNAGLSEKNGGVNFHQLRLRYSF